jgi:hypothetical protein
MSSIYPGRRDDCRWDQRIPQTQALALLLHLLGLSRLHAFACFFDVLCCWQFFWHRAPQLSDSLSNLRPISK